jgi:class 3 adenylate cyclase/tetratricopeptide (TPR) repeat protein
MTPAENQQEETCSTERRLAAILSADAKGFARLMGEDEAGTVRILTAYRSIMADTIVRFRGRVVDSPGDNVLAEFASVVDAVMSAVEIQEVLREHNARLVASRRLEFRIGVNLGDVLVEGERVYGNAVNIAARIEALADGGGICVSGTVYDQIAGKVALLWEFLGEQAVKNITRRVRVYRLRLEGAPNRSMSEIRVSSLDRPSIAVLPFREPDIAEGSSYFGDGIVEDIIGALACLPDLVVISRNSTSRFRGAPVDVGAVGRELGVRYVLSGSVRRAGERIRIMSELSDSETQRVLWTDKIDGRTDDLFDLQDRLSEKTITTIAPHVQEAEMRRVLLKRPENFGAYDFMLRGLELLYRLKRNEFDRAREMFEKSIALDPGYATPYALTALWHSIRIGQGWSEDRVGDYQATNRYGEAALERDPFDARALSLCGHMRALLFRDYEGAFGLFDRAIAVSPNSAGVWLRSSPTYSYIGDADEAERRAEIGLRLSPFDTHLFFAHTALGLACYTGGKYEDAVAWGRKARSLSPNYTANLRFLTASLAAAGRVSEAAEVRRALLELEPGFRVQSFCANYAYKDPARRAALADHLRSAGLPD